MKDSIAGLSSDKRLQLVLIAFCFGAFLEGTGGGGAPVAIAGAFLIGLGFNPFQAATLCLVANTAPVAWGGVGNPIRVLAGVTGLPEARIQRDGRAHSAAALADPAALAGAQHGGLARDVAGLAGAAGQRRLLRRACSSTGRTSRTSGWWTSWRRIFSLLVMVAFLKVWQPRDGDAGAAATWRASATTPFGRRTVLQGLVAVHRRVGADLRHRAARRSPDT